MEANYLKKLDYVCEHNHTFGHSMTLKWGDCGMKREGLLLELSVDFEQRIAGILVNGSLKSTFDIDGMTTEAFQKKIEECQDMFDELNKFN